MRASNHPRPLTRAPQPLAEPRRTGLPVHVVLAADPQWDLTDCEPLARLVFGVAVDDPETLACCLLPERFDWLLASGLRLTAKVEEIRGISTHAARRLGVHRPLWRPSFEARVLTRGEMERAVREIVRRPVVTGRAASTAAWPYQMRRL